MVQEPSEGRLSGNSLPAASAAARTSASVQPASTVIESLTVSTARTRFMRVSDSTIERPLSSGVAAPDRPVLPPCAISATRCSAHQRTIAATSSVDSGSATASARPK